MTQFEYLSVLISIIVGLAIAQLLSGAARLIQIRARVRPHATTLLWMATLFLIDTQIWWAAFERRASDEWNFFLFLFYLLQPILAFLLSFLILPELGDEDVIDLPGNFAGNRPWFFSLLALLPLVSLVSEYIDTSAIPHDEDAAFRMLFLVLSVVTGCVRNARAQLWLAIVALLLLCSYVALLFLHLQ